MGKEFLNIVKKTVGNSLQRERERERENMERLQGRGNYAMCL